MEEIVALRLPWCDLLHFRRLAHRPNDPTLLIVAPMSGHFATLLRGTVEAFLPDHDVYITDWQDAKDMPTNFRRLRRWTTISTTSRHSVSTWGPQTHMLAVCQPAVPVLASTALMNAAENGLVAPVDHPDRGPDRYTGSADRGQ